MSTTAAEGHHADHPSGIMRWITTTNHKDIGTLYLWFAFIMFFVGGFMALIIRSELFQPGLQFVDPQFFNSMTTMHALKQTDLNATRNADARSTRSKAARYLSEMTPTLDTMIETRGSRLMAAIRARCFDAVNQNF